jgi:ABC-2 type transport system ATP-binding protein
LAITMRLAGEDAVQLDGDAVLVDVPPERTPSVVRALVTEGLDVHEVQISERTLEEVFFEMTDTGLHAKAGDLETLEAVG